MTKKAAVTQSEIRRVIQGAKSAGLDVDAMEYEVDLVTGRLVMRPISNRALDDLNNPWDVVLQK